MGSHGSHATTVVLPTMLSKKSISHKCYKQCLGSQAGPSEVRWTHSAAGAVLLILG